MVESPEYRKVSIYVLRIVSVALASSFQVQIDAAEEKLIVFPISAERKPLEGGINIVHISTLRKQLPEMTMVPTTFGYQLEILYEEIVSKYVVRDSE